MSELEKLSPEEFRRKIAGLENQTEIKKLDRENLRNEAVRLSTILASLFSDDLDRMTLWDRIGSALIVSIAKSGRDLDQFINNCLLHVKAESSKVAASEPLKQMIENMMAKNEDWKQEFISYVEKHHYIILVHARARWGEVKSGKIEL